MLNYQYTRLYLIRDVPIETVFVPRTRKEIKCCEWFSIEHLPTHKTDPVSRNHLGINANSFFMIMPFVKRLKKWINEQALGLQVGKKSKASDSKHMLAAGVINSNATAAHLNERNEAKSPSTVFFKNNAGHRRQRHKSMGDFDSTNVVTHDSTGDTLHAKHTIANNKMDSGILNGCVDSNGVMSKSGGGCSGKQKLHGIDQTTNKRSSSPYLSNFQLQPVSSINSNGQVKKAVKQQRYTILKKNEKPPSRLGMEHNGDNYTLMEIQPEMECQMTSGRQKWLFNPPKLSQLLCKEPNIANWSNVRLNKDSIMHGSLKISGK